MNNEADRYRENAEYCFAAARIATAPGLAGAFERLAQSWLAMAAEAEQRERLRKKNEAAVHH
jgi:hypothetical protein